MEQRASERYHYGLWIGNAGGELRLKQEGCPPPLGINSSFLKFVSKCAAHAYPAELPRLMLVSVGKVPFWE